MLIWEASENYLYARTTADGRIIVGGEDDKHAIEPDARDALMPAKADAILRRLSALWPKAEPTAEFVWSGAFGTTDDGLPLIGRVPGHPGIHAAYGYGGNGITFSYLAAQMIGELIAGRDRPWFDDFAIDRDPAEETLQSAPRAAAVRAERAHADAAEAGQLDRGPADVEADHAAEQAELDAFDPADRSA